MRWDSDDSQKGRPATKHQGARGRQRMRWMVLHRPQHATCKLVRPTCCRRGLKLRSKTGRSPQVAAGRAVLVESEQPLLIRILMMLRSVGGATLRQPKLN